MRIGVFTSNQPRHIAFVERLVDHGHQVTVIQEVSDTEGVPRMFQASVFHARYFARLRAAERKLFGADRPLPSMLLTRAIPIGTLSEIDPLDPVVQAVLAADQIVVFGASFIRGALAKRCIAAGALNLHMGVAPYYRGSSSNFWAMWDGRFDLVGATLHRLTSGLDCGPILFHSLPPPAKYLSPFSLGMQAVKSAIEQVANLLSCQTAALRGVTTTGVGQEQFGGPTIYRRHREFDEGVVASFLSRKWCSDTVEASMRKHKHGSRSGARALTLRLEPLVDSTSTT